MVSHYLRDTFMIATIAGIKADQNPFSMNSENAYRHWRDQKLKNYPQSKDQLLVEINDPLALNMNEKEKLLSICQKTNMVIYQTAILDDDKELPKQLGRQLGLHHLDQNMLADDDGITSLGVMPGKHKRGYIPYSNKRLLWHTDGYYNDSSHQIKAMLLHCVRPAQSGGENSLFDHEMVYLLLREQDPILIKALMEPDVMTIPANQETNEINRPSQTGPVFMIDEKQGSLHMRYTARTHSIDWKNNDETIAAVKALTTLLASDCEYIFQHRLEAGQGIICNNILHNRTGFTNGEAVSDMRLIYRARYYDRVSHNTT